MCTGAISLLQQALHTINPTQLWSTGHIHGLKENITVFKHLHYISLEILGVYSSGYIITVVIKFLFQFEMFLVLNKFI